MIDCHCHLDDFLKKNELEAVLARAESAGVSRFVCAGTSVEDWEIYQKLAQNVPAKIAYTVGLHPCEADENWESQLSELAQYFKKENVPVAIGEIGLDEHWLPKNPVDAAPVRARQAAAFSAQLDFARQLGVPVVVHARNAFAQCVSAIDKSGIDWRKVVFHCFSEGADEVRLLNARGGRASFTGTITYKNAENVRQAALAQGLSRLMLETDCPYLAPQKLRGQRNEPAFLHASAEFSAELFGVSLETLDAQTVRNTREFFQL